MNCRNLGGRDDSLPHNLGLLLRALFGLAIWFAGGLSLLGQERVEYPAQIQERLELTQQLSSYGYYHSALHYLKNIYRDAELSPEQLSDIKKRIASTEKAIAKLGPEKTLPDLEVMLHFKGRSPESQSEDLRTDETSLLKGGLVRGQEFPSNRIDKMKWLKRTLIFVGCVWVGYRLHELLNPRDDEIPNAVNVEF